MTKNRNQPGLRLMIYDATEKRWGRFINLSLIWRIGGWLYRLLGRLDRHHGATSWADALVWLGTVEPAWPIAEIQYWGHGRWGRVLIRDESLDIGCLDPQHPLHPHLDRIRNRLVANDPTEGEPARWWFRTCETFGAECGQAFAMAWADFFNCRVAGHTHVIGFYQSGLHSLRPGARPGWSADEGIIEGDADNPQRAAGSRRGMPNRITCFGGRVPDGW